MKVKRNDLCPCGSNVKAKRCCLQSDGTAFRSRHAIARGDAQLSHQSCYLRGLGGCSTKLTREHLMSDAIPIAKGPRALHGPRSQVLPPYPALAATTAKVLCSTHNSALGSTFDPIGIELHKALTGALRGESGQLLVNGHDVENFVIQRLAAHHFGGLFTRNGENLKSYSIDTGAIERSFAGGDLPTGAGLYLTPPPPHFEAYQFGYEIAPITQLIEHRILGARITFGPLGLLVLLESPEGPLNIPLIAYRPAGVLFRFPGGSREIQFSWEDGPKTARLEFDADFT